MLGLLQQLTFNSAQIRFDDGSITSRALEFAGKQQGVSGKQLARRAEGDDADHDGSAQHSGTAERPVSAAVSTYLDNPKSLAVTAAPDKPVPLPMIIGAAMGAPRSDSRRSIGLKVIVQRLIEASILTI